LTLGAEKSVSATIFNDDGDLPIIVNGTKRADALYGTEGQDIMSGFAKNDMLHGSLGADLMDGGTGTDTVNYSASGEAVSVNLAAGLGGGGYAEGDRYVSIENVVGSSFNDRIAGDAGNNSLSGGNGDDLFMGDLGKDTINGGDGNDTVSYAASASQVIVDLSRTKAQSGGDASGDKLSSIENLVGSNFGDTLKGNSANNVLNGGAGNDMLTGGLGNDTFEFSGNFGSDTITDYQDGVDKIAISTELPMTFEDLTITGQGTTTMVISGFADGSSITVKSSVATTLDAGDFILG
jgi:Ca2+-binding RTX toxin-like protein